MRYALIACLGFMAVACSRHADVASTPGSAALAVIAREWTLVSLREDPIPAGGRAVTLRFDGSARRASGYGPCNQYSAPYTMTGDSLRFGPIVATKMACTDNHRNVLEQAFFAALSETMTYQAADSTLTLFRAGGRLARFRSR